MKEWVNEAITFRILVHKIQNKGIKLPFQRIYKTHGIFTAFHKKTRFSPLVSYDWKISFTKSLQQSYLYHFLQLQTQQHLVIQRHEKSTKYTFKVITGCTYLCFQSQHLCIGIFTHISKQKINKDIIMNN